jgi:Zn-dependent peptidase ImmA (M78 family)
MYERMALQIRHFAKVDLAAKLDPFALAKSINVRVLYLSDLTGLSESSRERLDVPDGWSGGATQALEDGSHIVILNQRHSSGRQAATLMEEVCHILFGHRPSEIGADQVGGRSYNFSVEEEAYAVGAAALVPYHSLKAFLISGASIRKIAAHFGVTSSLIVYRTKGTGLGKFLS